MTVVGSLRHRRALRDRREVLAANDALFGVARDFRSRAQAQINAGHPEAAAPYLEEAELFESAALPVPGL